MDRGADRRAWDHTAPLLWALVNTHRDPKKPAVPLWMFHPYLRPDSKGQGGVRLRITADNLWMLKKYFPPKRGRKEGADP